MKTHVEPVPKPLLSFATKNAFWNTVPKGSRPGSISGEISRAAIHPGPRIASRLWDRVLQRPGEMVLRILAGLAFGLLLFPASARWARNREDRPGALERKNQELIRSSGFQDAELERLHEKLGKQVQALAASALPEVEGNSAEKPGQPGTDPAGFQSVTGETKPALIPSREHSFVKGTDREGRVYYRLQLKEGLNYTTEPRPDRFIFRAHAYLYLNQAGTGLDKIILQFYRIRFSRSAYVREIRRIIHPGPFGPGASNAGILLEFRHYPEIFPRADLTVDGIPRPVLSGEPGLQTRLHTPDEPLSFDKQSRILETYRSLIRKLDRQMSVELELRRLNRNSAIERAMDFTGTSF